MEYFDKAREYYDKAVKAVSKTETEKKLSEALSRENWGASTTLLREIAQLTYNWQEYGVVMRELWNTLNSNTKNWRQKFKGLTLLEYLVKNGTEKVVEEARENVYAVKLLTSYSMHVDGVEKGAGVREKAKQIIELLNDNELIREEREKAHALKDKYTGIGRDGSTHGASYNSGSYDSGGGRYGRESRGFGNDEKSWDKGFDSKKERYSDVPKSSKSSKSRSGDLTGSESEGETTSRRRRHKEKKKKSKKSKSKKHTKEDDADFGDFSAGKTEEVDLFGGGNDVAAAAGPKEEIFDPFGNTNANAGQGSDEWAAFTSAPAPTPAPVSSNPTPASNDFGDFGDFSSAPAAAQPQQTVDFFDTPQPQSNDLMGNFQMGGGNDLLGGTPQQQPMMVNQNAMQAPMGAPINNNLLGDDLLGSAQPMQTQQPVQDNLMGNFQMGGTVPMQQQTVQPVQQQTQPNATDNILGSNIIDLDNLSLNSSKPKTSINNTPNRSTAQTNGSIGMQQPMNMMAQQQMGGMQQPMNMMAQQPMNMMAQQPMMAQQQMGGMQQPMNMMAQQPMMGQQNSMQQPMNMMGGMQQPMNMMGGMQQPMNMMGNQQKQQQSPF